jgi:hypothetical protein
MYFFSNRVEGGGGGLTVSGVSRNRGSFAKCVAIQKRFGIPALEAKMEPTNIQMVRSLMLILNKQQLPAGPINIGLTGRPMFLAQSLILQKAYIYHRQQEKQQMKFIKNFCF